MSQNSQHQCSVAKKRAVVFVYVHNHIFVPQKPLSPSEPRAYLWDFMLSVCFSLRLTSKMSTTTRSRLSLKTSKCDLSNSLVFLFKNRGKLTIESFPFLRACETLSLSTHTWHAAVRTCLVFFIPDSILPSTSNPNCPFQSSLLLSLFIYLAQTVESCCP